MDMSLRARSTSSKQTSTSPDASEIPLLPTNNNDNNNNNNHIPERPPIPRPSISQRALESTAHLANLLPTGTLLAFQLLIPIFTNNGTCDNASRPMTLILLALLAFSCFLACFTDSYKAPDGQIYYGLATFKGLWIFDYQAASISGVPSELNRPTLGLFSSISRPNTPYFRPISFSTNNPAHYSTLNTSPLQQQFLNTTQFKRNPFQQYNQRSKHTTTIPHLTRPFSPSSSTREPKFKTLQTQKSRTAAEIAENPETNSSPAQ